MSGELLGPRADLAPIAVGAGTCADDANFQLVDRGLVEAGMEWAIAPFCTCIRTGGFDKSFVDRGDGKYVAACCYRPAEAVYYFKGNDKMPADFKGRAFGPAEPQPSLPLEPQSPSLPPEETPTEAVPDGHTRESTHLGPDYCRECSKAISDWVTWPCPPSLGEAPPADGYRVAVTAQTTDGPRSLTSEPMTHGEAADALAGVIAGVGEEYVVSAEILPLPPPPASDPWATWVEPADPSDEDEAEAELAEQYAADACGVCGHPGEHWVDGEPVPCPTGLTREQAAAQRELAESVQREVTYPDALAAHEADEEAARRAWDLELCDSMEIPRGQCAHCLGQTSPEIDAVVYGHELAEDVSEAARALGRSWAQSAHETPVPDVVEDPSPAAPEGASVGGSAPAATSEKTKASMKFSNSEIRKFKRCRRAWWLTYFRGLTPRREGVGPLSLGNMVHKPLELYYAEPVRDPAAFDWETPLAEYVEARLADPELPEHLHADMLADYELVKIMLRGYFEWLVEEGTDSEIVVLAAEREIEAFLDTIGDVEVWLIGKLDGEIELKSDGRRGFIDHKSAANLTDLPKMGQKDEQFQHYGLLQRLEALAEGRTDARFANGGVWNILRKVKRTASARPPFYGRVTVRHNDEVYRNYYARVWGEVRDILAVRAALEAGGNHHVEAYPNPTRDCSWDCPFVSICPQFDDGSDVEAVLGIDFVVHDPYARYTEIEKGGPTV